MISIRPVDRGRVRVDEQFVGIEPVASIRVIPAICPQTISGAGPDTSDMAGENATGLAFKLDARGFAIARFIEEANPDALGRGGPNRKTNAEVVEMRSRQGLGDDHEKPPAKRRTVT